jgi:hypothetical protein
VRRDTAHEQEDRGDIASWYSELLFFLSTRSSQIDDLLARLETLQERIPAPSIEELAAIRAGGRPLSPEAHAIGVLQRTIMSLENGIWDLRTGLEMETLAQLADRTPIPMEINAILSGIGSRARSKASRRRR